MTDTDPRLVEAEKEIDKILSKYELAGAVCLASDSHAQFVLKFPKWSLITFEGENLQMRTDANKPELSERSAHLLFALRDMVGMQHAGLSEASSSLISAIEESGGSVDQVPFEDFD